MRIHGFILTFACALIALPACPQSAFVVNPGSLALPGADYGSAAWGDFDGDNRLDFVLSGGGRCGVYRNAGDGTFSDINAGLPPSFYTAATWGDFNSDNRLDLLYQCGLFRNDGQGAFLRTEAGLACIQYSYAAWGDFNNDGLMDIRNGASDPGLHQNAGQGVFTTLDTILPTAGFGRGGWGDFDRDGWLDLLQTGRQMLFRNNRDGTFAPIDAGLPEVYNGAASWGDYDNDGWLDVLLTGTSVDGTIARVYRNLGNSHFTDINAGLMGAYHGDAVWGDYDNDGRLDILLTGYAELDGEVPIARVYRNRADGTFADIGAELPGVGLATAAWGDYDDDGKLDILLAGSSVTGRVSRIYRNVTPVANTPPASPTGLTAARVSNAVTFSWNAASDHETPAPGLSYNLRVGTFPGGTDVVSPMAAASGFRRVATFGNAGQATSRTLTFLPAGTYFWSVQSIDTAFAGSAFAPEQSLLVPGPPTAINLGSTNVTGHEAELVGVVSANGFATAVWFAWGTNGFYENVTPPILLSATDHAVPVRSTLTNLAPRRWHSFRLIAVSSAGTNESTGRAFTTLPDPPVMLSQTAFNLATNFATIRASIHPNGGATAAYFQYGTTTNYTGATALTNLGGGLSPVSIERWLIGLLPGVTYHFRTVASNVGGVTYGADTTFRTRIAPTVVTLTAASVTPTNALLQGTVNPNGEPTRARFEYGITPGYGSRTPWVELGDGTNAVPVTALVDGLLPSAVHYFRAVGSNSAGMFVGQVSMFLTGPGFTSATNTGLPGVRNGSVAWGDYNNDGRLDALLSGQAESNQRISQIWRNDGDGVFSNAVANLPGVDHSAVAWGDFDQDGWLDLVLCGSSSSGFLSRVYRNSTDGTFQDINAGLRGLANGSAEWGDYDSDGRPDILLTGSNDVTGQLFARVYRNEGNNTFRELDVGLPGVHQSAAAWGDFDNDGRPDILLTGASATGLVASIYQNLGNGMFADIGAGLPGVSESSVDWGDFNSDGQLDLALAGLNSAKVSIGRIYRQSAFGQAARTFINVRSLAGLDPGEVRWGDYDSDGRLDLAVCGVMNSINGPAPMQIYRGNWGDTFSRLDVGLSSLQPTAAAWGDYDRDGRLDLLLTGNDAVDDRPQTRLLRNVTLGSNAPPSTPVWIETTFITNGVRFMWDFDPTHVQRTGLSYNLRVGTTPGGSDIVAPEAGTNGLRRVVRAGNAGSGYFWVLRTNLPAHRTFYWSVQSIDASFAGSRFTAERAFATGPSAFISLGLRSNGTFEGEMRSWSGRVYEVMASTNLLQWNSIGSTRETAPGFYRFTDPTAGQHSKRFYQLRDIPPWF